MSGCELNQIFLGEVASVQNYGAFIKIPGCKQQGLVHKTQLSSSHVDDVSQILDRGERVWCKVISLGDDGKVALSMKHVNQGNGKDLDPNGVQLQQDQQRRTKIVNRERKAITLEAVYNTTCTKCGTAGHLSKDCFMSTDGKKYDLIPELEEHQPQKSAEAPEADSEVIKKHKKKSKKRKKSNKSNRSSSDDDSDRKKKKKKKMKKRSREKISSSSDSSDSSSSSDDDSRGRKRKSSSSSKHKHSKKTKHS